MLTIFVVLCGLLVTANAQEKFKCPQEEVDSFDVISGQLISFQDPHQRKFPEASPEIPKYCTYVYFDSFCNINSIINLFSETKADIKSLSDISQKCFTGTAKQFSSIIIYSVNYLSKKIFLF